MTYALKFPCKVCEKNVNDNDQSIQDDLCKSWVHIKCNNLIMLIANTFKAVMIPSTVFLTVFFSLLIL